MADPHVDDPQTLLQHLLDGALNATQAQAAQARLAQDPVWGPQLRAHQRLQEGLRGLGPMAAPAGLERAVVARLERQKTGLWAGLRRWMVPAAVGGALVAAGVLLAWGPGGGDGVAGVAAAGVGGAHAPVVVITVPVAMGLGQEAGERLAAWGLPAGAVVEMEAADAQAALGRASEALVVEINGALPQTGRVKVDVRVVER